MNTAPSLGPDDPDNALPEPANLKFLRLLVTTLTAIMILGTGTIIALLFLRLQAPEPLSGGVSLPDTITLPAGTAATAFTQGPDWYAVVTDDNRILIFDRASGALRQSVTVQAAP